ncbi:MAG: ABC transporter substrate-binding protein [Chloroflexota bacterium]|nr:ABC transporter substrate-binding protein [Chloroflexota bacterium]MDE2941931.1 ABC transporter substrate-binding protein [Chloroflexota bacterium]MDE3268632.1 ABC transporter substrate-binding protein [Chloroflexota bacterium]
MRTRRIVAIAAAFLALPFVLSCTSDEATPTPSPTPMLPATEVAPDTGVLNLASPLTLNHWDVHLSPSHVLASWGPGIVYSRLLRFQSGPDVETPTQATECDLCESWEQVDATTYLFRLREGVLWHDVAPVNGRELVAQDVLYSLRRQLTPSYPNAGILEAVHTIEAEDRYTLRITLRSPDADFLASLASGFTKVVAPEAVELNGDLREGPVIGSGPWLWDGTRDDIGYYFKANPAYYESDLPGLDRLNLITIVDEFTRMAAFRTRRLDLLEAVPADFNTIREGHPDVGFQVYPEAGSGLELALNTNSPPLDDLAVRRAVFAALDPWEARDAVWDGLGFVSLGMPVAGPGWLLPEEEMRAHLALPGARGMVNDLPEESRSLTLTVADYGDAYLEYGRRLAEQLSRQGFRVDTRTVTPTDYPHQVWYNGDYQAFVGPIAPISTPNMYLRSVLHSGGEGNTHGYRSDALDALIEEQAAKQDAAWRQELALAIQRHVMEQAVRFMPQTRESTWVWWPWVEGFHANLSFGEYFHLARLRVES